jgi:hypothetical protein
MEGDCPICLELLSLNDVLTHTTECNHTFHATCFRKLTVLNCPCCRRQVTRCVVIINPALLEKKRQSKIKRISKQIEKESQILYDYHNSSTMSIYFKISQNLKVQNLRKQLIEATEIV